LTLQPPTVPPQQPAQPKMMEAVDKLLSSKSRNLFAEADIYFDAKRNEQTWKDTIQSSKDLKKDPDKWMKDRGVKDVPSANPSSAANTSSQQSSSADFPESGKKKRIKEGVANYQKDQSRLSPSISKDKDQSRLTPSDTTNSGKASVLDSLMGRETQAQRDKYNADRDAADKLKEAVCRILERRDPQHPFTDAQINRGLGAVVKKYDKQHPYTDDQINKGLGDVVKKYDDDHVQKTNQIAAATTPQPVSSCAPDKVGVKNYKTGGGDQTTQQQDTPAAPAKNYARDEFQKNIDAMKSGKAFPYNEALIDMKQTPQKPPRSKNEPPGAKSPEGVPTRDLTDSVNEVKEDLISAAVAILSEKRDGLFR